MYGNVCFDRYKKLPLQHFVPIFPYWLLTSPKMNENILFGVLKNTGPAWFSRGIFTMQRPFFVQGCINSFLIFFRSALKQFVQKTCINERV